MDTEKCSALLKEKHLQTSSSKASGADGALMMKAYVPVAYKHPNNKLGRNLWLDPFNSDVSILPKLHFQTSLFSGIDYQPSASTFIQQKT